MLMKRIESSNNRAPCFRETIPLLMGVITIMIALFNCTMYSEDNVDDDADDDDDHE